MLTAEMWLHIHCIISVGHPGHFYVVNAYVVNASAFPGRAYYFGSKQMPPPLWMLWFHEKGQFILETVILIQEWVSLELLGSSAVSTAR